jgi:hypothetical protein
MVGSIVLTKTMPISLFAQTAKDYETKKKLINKALLTSRMYDNSAND